MSMLACWHVQKRKAPLCSSFSEMLPCGQVFEYYAKCITSHRLSLYFLSNLCIYVFTDTSYNTLSEVHLRWIFKHVAPSSSTRNYKEQEKEDLIIILKFLYFTRTLSHILIRFQDHCLQNNDISEDASEAFQAIKNHKKLSILYVLYFAQQLVRW